MVLQKTILSIAAPYLIGFIVDIFDDAISPEGVIEYRDEILKKLISFVQVKQLPFEDKIASIAEKMFDAENIEEYGLWAIGIAKKHVQHNETKWDDFSLPLLETLEKMCMEISAA